MSETTLDATQLYVPDRIAMVTNHELQTLEDYIPPEEARLDYVNDQLETRRREMDMDSFLSTSRATQRHERHSFQYLATLIILEYRMACENDARRSPAKVIVDRKISNPVVISKGVRQGDGLSATPFNLVLHKAVQNLEQSNTILNRLTQICWYADILVIARSLPALEELCAELSTEAGKVSLVVSPDNTKYMGFSAPPSPTISERGNHKWCNL